MKLNSTGDLTYCTNIHPGESWQQVFRSLQQNVPDVKAAVSPHNSFGLGLRLSNQASEEILAEGLDLFKQWLAQQDLYVFTMNGFPYGGFHRQTVKDQVHQPDWTTMERVDYTLRLFEILSQLLPPGKEGGISTSPLSYKPWFQAQQLPEIVATSTKNILSIVKALYRYQSEENILMHLDIEPEPDGVLENSQETVAFYRDWLIPQGTVELASDLGISKTQAEEAIRRHVQICYDICHFAVAYEKPGQVMSLFKDHDIQVGKIQISAALKKEFPEDNDRSAYYQAFSTLDEPTYLHQVVARDNQGKLKGYRDLPEALESFNSLATREWRTHFHVPVFVDSYGVLEATQQDIVEVLTLWKEAPMTTHLEVETYTWEVLPSALQTDITDSIARELLWVIDQLKD